MRTLIMMLGTVLISTMAVAGQGAAAWYWKAADGLHALSSSDWQVLNAFLENPGPQPSPDLRVVISRATPILRVFRRGSLAEWSDFDRDAHGALTNSSMPKLGDMRRIFLLTRADVLVHVHDGNGNAAADRVASAYRAAEHFRGDREVSSSARGIGGFKTTESAMQFGLDRGAFSAQDAAVMESALDRLAGRDPFGVVESLAYEQGETVQWLLDEWGDDDGWLGIIATVSENNAGQAESLAQLDDDAFDDAIGQYDRFMDLVVVAISSEDREQARNDLARLDAELAAGEHGLLAQIVVGDESFTIWLEIMQRVEQDIRAQVATLKELASGAVDPQELVNAAVLYAEAIAMLRRLEPSKIELIAASASDAIDATPVLRETLRETAPIIDLLRKGSKRRRCDFSFLRPGVSWKQFCPEYVAGMADAILLLKGDAIFRLRDDDTDAAVDRLLIIIGVIRHLSDDEPIVSALLAHDAFNQAMTLTQRIVVRPTATSDRVKALFAVVDQIGRTDPFGYIASMRAARTAISMRLQGELERAGEDPDHIAAQVSVLRRFDGDHLLYLLVAYEALSRSSTGEGADDPATSLSDVLSMPDLQNARREASGVAALVTAKQLEVLRELPIPCVGHVMEHMRSARSDLRRAMKMLAPAESPPTKEDEHKRSQRDVGPQPRRTNTRGASVTLGRCGTEKRAISGRIWPRNPTTARCGAQAIVWGGSRVVNHGSCFPNRVAVPGLSSRARESL